MDEQNGGGDSDCGNDCSNRGDCPGSGGDEDDPTDSSLSSGPPSSARPRRSAATTSSRAGQVSYVLHVCEECGLECEHGDQRRHRKDYHSGDCRFRCDCVCDATFQRRGQLRRHQQVVHGWSSEQVERADREEDNNNKPEALRTKKHKKTASKKAKAKQSGTAPAFSSAASDYADAAALLSLGGGKRLERANEKNNHNNNDDDQDNFGLASLRLGEEEAANFSQNEVDKSVGNFPGQHQPPPSATIEEQLSVVVSTSQALNEFPLLNDGLILREELLPVMDDSGGVLVAASTVGLVQQQVAVPVAVTRVELYSSGSSSSSSSSDNNDDSDDDGEPVFQSLEPVAVEGVPLPPLPPPPMPTPLQDEIVSELSAAGDGGDASSPASPTLAASMPVENSPPAAAAAAIPVENILPAALAAPIPVENILPAASAAPMPVENIPPAAMAAPMHVDNIPPATPMPVENIPQTAFVPAIPVENIPAAAAIPVENIPPAAAAAMPNFIQQHPAASVPTVLPFKPLFSLAANSQPIGFQALPPSSLLSPSCSSWKSALLALPPNMSVYAQSPAVIVYGPPAPPSPPGTVYCPPLMIAMMPQQQPLQSSTTSTNPKDHLQHWREQQQQQFAVGYGGQLAFFNPAAVPSFWGNVNAVPWMISSTENGGGGTPFEQWQQMSSTGSPPPLPTPPTPSPSPSPSVLRLLSPSTTPDPSITSAPASPIISTPAPPNFTRAATEATDDDDNEPFPSDLPDAAANSCAQAEQNFLLEDSQQLIEQQQQLQEEEEDEEFVKEKEEEVVEEEEIEEEMEIMEDEMEIMEEEMMMAMAPLSPAPPLRPEISLKMAAVSEAHHQLLHQPVSSASMMMVSVGGGGGSMASFSQSYRSAFEVSSPSSLTFDSSFSSSVLANDVSKHQSPRPQVLPQLQQQQQQPKPEENLSLSSQSNVKVMASPGETTPSSPPPPPPEQRQNSCSQQQQSSSSSSATNGHHHYQPPSNNNNGSSNSTSASSSSSSATTTSHSEAPTRGHRSRKQTLPPIDVSPPNLQNELPDSDEAAEEVPPPPPPQQPISSPPIASSSSAASAPLPPPSSQSKPTLLPPVNALNCVTFFCRHCRRLLSLPGGQEAVDAHRNAHQNQPSGSGNSTGISRLPRYLPNALAASGVKRANDGAGVAGEVAVAVEVGVGEVGSGDSGGERAAKRQARLEREAEVAQRFPPSPPKTRLKKMLELEPKRLEELHHAIQMRTRNSGGGEGASAAEEAPNEHHHQQQNNDQHMEEEDGEDVVGDANYQYDNDEGDQRDINADVADQEFMEEEEAAME
ncbi:hypothetical protein TYRP_015148 [Tyrophagus putrescentiae]|nr:hypothetical protein TYRP_015148 [Tyrophagus putrescentiae]